VSLTQKQEVFCQSYIETGSATEAYKRHYNAKNMKAEVIHVKACELLTSGKVAVRIKELQGEVRDRHNITIDDLLIELEEARLAAKGAKPTVQASAMVAATMAKAKLLGFDDKRSNPPPEADVGEDYTLKPDEAIPSEPIL
jgi:phage terminase small subunit